MRNGCDQVMLEKPNADYCAWLRKPTSWGGAIELNVLAQLHSVEIVALNVQTAQPLRFGEGECRVSINLMVVIS